MLIRARQVLLLADTLRAHALDCGADLNAANLFAHNVLARAMRAGISLDDVALGATELHARHVSQKAA